MNNKPFVEINDYISKHEIHSEYGLNDEAAASALNTFKTCYLEWKKIIGRLLNTEDGDALYGNAIYVYAVAIHCSKKIPDDGFALLLSESSEYENTVKHKYGIKSNIFLILSMIWLRKGAEYRETAILTGEKYIFYQQIEANHTEYNLLTCYSFRKCTTFLYQSLINDTIQLTSPTEFNDIFDCPILDYLEHGDNTSQLLKEAYLRGVKIACFVSNNKLPVLDKFTLEYKRMPKHDNDKEEFLNPLMWAHYADSHRGVCLKYGFPSEITQFGAASDSDYVSYFNDVIYTNQLPQYNKGISVQEAFWYKSKEWEYENELRLLYFHPNVKDKHVTIPALNSVESVYFGVQCSPKDRETIRNILKERKFVYKHSHYDKQNRKTIEESVEKDITFYQMVKDENEYGSIKAIKL